MDRAADPLSTDHRRYGLADPTDRLAAEAEGKPGSFGGQPEEGAPGEVRKHMSAYERRVQKKVRLQSEGLVVCNTEFGFRDFLIMAFLLNLI
jgi:hypothetical protein